MYKQYILFIFFNLKGVILFSFLEFIIFILGYFLE